jgi:hypothetical protein
MHLWHVLRAGFDEEDGIGSLGCPTRRICTWGVNPGAACSEKHDAARRWWLGDCQGGKHGRATDRKFAGKIWAGKS